MAGSPLPQAGEKPRDIKLNNRRIVLGLLARKDRATLGELAAESALSRNTVKKCVDFFLQKGLVADAGKGISTSEGGKKPDMFALDRRWGSIASFYCCGTELSGGLYDLTRDCLCEARENLPAYTPEAVVAGCRRLLDRMLAESPERPGPLRWVTCSIHGIVDIHTGTVLSNRQDAWNGRVPLGDMLREALGAPVSCCNPVRTMLLCEADADPAVADNSAIVYTNGPGAMAAIIRRGIVVQGKRCVLGEIAGIPLGFSAHPASDTALGGDSLGYLVCRKKLLEEIASQPVLYQTSGLSELGRQPTLHDIFSAAGLGDKLARAVVRYAARWFAVSLRQLLFLADPDIIIIQGDYAPAGQYFLDTLRQYVQSYVAPAVDVIPDIRLSRLGETASCLLGGALIGRGAVFEDDSLYE